MAITITFQETGEDPTVITVSDLTTQKLNRFVEDRAVVGGKTMLFLNVIQESLLSQLDTLYPDLVPTEVIELEAQKAALEQQIAQLKQQSSVVLG